MYISGLLAIISFSVRDGLLTPMQSLGIGLLLLLPGGVDGTTQLRGDRESTNPLRLATGILLGMGVVLFAEGILFLVLRS